MFKKLWHRFLKDGGIFEVLITTFIVAVFQFTIKAEFPKDLLSLLWDIGLNVLQGFSVGLFLFFVINMVEIRFEAYSSKQNEYKLTINTDAYLNNIKEDHGLIYGYLKEMVSSLIENCLAIQSEKDIVVNAHEIYLHIIHSSKTFIKNVISVDLDLDAWYYACELEDFDFISSYYKNKKRGSDEKQTKEIKKIFEGEFESRRRIDLTCNISKNLTDRIDKFGDNSPIGAVNTVRRLIILEKAVSDLNPHEAVILAFFKRISEKTRSTIHNKYLVKSSITQGSDDARALIKLQDIILFDSQIAFKEYILNDKNGNSDSRIVTKLEDISEYEKLFDKLFRKGSELSEIFK